MFRRFARILLLQQRARQIKMRVCTKSHLSPRWRLVLKFFRHRALAPDKSSSACHAQKASLSAAVQFDISNKLCGFLCVVWRQVMVGRIPKKRLSPCVALIWDKCWAPSRAQWHKKRRFPTCYAKMLFFFLFKSLWNPRDVHHNQR